MIGRPGRVFRFLIIFFLVLVIFLIFILYLIGRSALLEYRFKPGDTFKYRISLLFTGETLQQSQSLPINSSVTCEVTQRVSSVAEDGTMNIEVTTERGSGTVSGTPVAFSKMPPRYTLKMAPNGKFLEVAGALNPNDISNLEFILPRRKIKPGDTWQEDRKLLLPGQPAPLFIPCKYRFEQWQRVKGYECAVIRGEIADTEIPLSQSTPFSVRLWGDGSIYFAYPQGVTILYEFNLYINFFKGKQPDLKLKIRSTSELE